MKILYLILFLSIILVALFISCDNKSANQSTEDISYKITGKVILFKGTPPENTDRIEVFAMREFPPQDPQNFLYMGRSGALDYSSGDTINYEIKVSPNEYEMIALLWKEKDQDWNLTNIIGFFTGPIPSVFPSSVVVSQENPVADSVDFYVNWEVVSKEANISGKITYQGEWPEDTQLLLLAVYREKPTSEFQYISFENADYTQPIFIDSSTYRLAVNSGVYNYIVLFWVGRSISELTDLVEIGVYEDPEEPGKPGTAEITAGSDSTNYDIYVNFDNIEFP